MLKNSSLETIIREQPVNVPFAFNIELKPSLPATTQNRTGRCWLFSGLTMLRYLSKTDDEFSYAYLFYHDKVQRYRQTLMTLAELPPDMRTHRYVIYHEAMSDGGQWDLFASLVKRFGLVPRSAMPETYHSSSSKGMNRLANRMLRVHESRLMAVKDMDERCKLVDALTEEAAHVFADLLGTPPTTVEIDDTPTEPTAFFKKMNLDLDAFVSIVHDPRRQEDAPPQWYELECVFDCNGQRVGWLAVSMARLEALALKALQNGEAVWFGANVEDLDRDNAVHDPSLGDFTKVWPWMGMSKREKLETFHAVPSHAMVMTGVHVHANTKLPVRWKIDNSWGQGGPNKGKHVMTAAGFREFVFQVVIRRSFLTSDETAAVAMRNTENATLVPPDDPLATLAR